MTSNHPIRANLVGSDMCAAEGAVARGPTPVLQLCRKLLAAGFSPRRSMEVYRGDTLALNIRSIGEAANLEINGAGNGFRQRHGQDAASVVRFSEPRRPEIAEAPNTRIGEDGAP